MSERQPVLQLQNLSVRLRQNHQRCRVGGAVGVAGTEAAQRVRRRDRRPLSLALRDGPPDETPAAVMARARWWVLLALAYSVGVLMHLRFSLWLVRPRETPFGSLALADLVPALSIVAAFAVAAAIVLQLRRSPRPWMTAGFWLAWIAAAVAVDRTLTFSANEWAHYPQYALIAWLLARATDPGRNRWHVGRILFWVTLMGAGDELLQYL